MSPYRQGAPVDPKIALDKLSDRYTENRALCDALAKQGLRPAMEDESGWYVPLIIDGELRKVWATDEP